MTIKQLIKKLRKFDIIAVQWKDITTDSSWVEEKKIEEFKPSKCTSIGFFIGRKGDNITISYSYDFDLKCGSVEVIPIGVILGITKHGRV